MSLNQTLLRDLLPYLESFLEAPDILRYQEKCSTFGKHCHLQMFEKNLLPRLYFHYHLQINTRHRRAGLQT